MNILMAIANTQEKRMIEGSFIYDTNNTKVASFSYGDKALEYYKVKEPDVLVLDAIMPGIDGLAFMEEIRDIRKKCKIIILSSSQADSIVDKAFSLGADYVMVKPYDINSLKRRIYDMQAPGEITDKAFESPADKNYIEKQIATILNGSGIFPNLKGYRYLKSALMYGYKDEEMLDGVTKILYPKIARDYNTTSDRVERAIRHAIESAWIRSDNNNFYEKIGFVNYQNRKRPTNSEYIFTALEYLKNEILVFNKNNKSRN